MRTFLVLCKKRKFSPMPPPPSTQRNKEEILFRCEHFLCYARNENFSPSPPSTLVLLYCKFLIEIHAVQLDSWIFKEEILFRCEHFLCYGRNENISPSPPPQLEDLRKKFSLHANISCVKQKSKLFHQAPPLTLVLLYCKFLTEIHAVQFDSGIFKEEILFRCKNFLCYARNKNFSPRPPPSTLVLLYCKFLIENHSV